MGIKDFLQKKFTKDEDFKEAEKQLKIQKILEQRQKSSNERELEKYFEEKRQEKIKNQLDKIRKQKTRELFSGGLMDKTNIFKNHDSILRNGPSIFKKTPKQKSVFFK